MRLVSANTKRLLRWHDAKWELCTGDLLLCRASSLQGRLIERVTRSKYTHIAMAGWVYPSWSGVGHLMQAETIQWRAARLIDLCAEVHRWPGYYDVWRAKRSWDTRTGWEFMLDAAGSCYGWRYLSRIWLRRRLGKWIPPIPNSNDPKTNRDCSGLIHAMFRVCRGPRLHEYDCDCAPGDFAKSEHFVYVGTLVE